MNNYEIKFLADYPHLLPEIGQLWYDEIGKLWIPNATPKAAEENFESHLNRDCLPLTFIVMHNKMSVGMCSLRADDGIGDVLTPWLASLIVHPKHRGQGIGESLIKKIEEQAYKIGYKKLYLFALDPNISNWYKRLGWRVIGMDKLYHHPVTVMEIEIGATSAGCPATSAR